ncbi:sigma factor G inhibitor Gin [Oceanobacillus sp. CAU 1775]
MENVKATQRCGICEEQKELGIHLYTLFICTDCEFNMIHTEPHEEKYRYYVKKLKNINQHQLYS